MNKRRMLSLAVLAAMLAPATGLAASEITLTKPVFRWLWGGFGFHSSESSLTGVMTEEFRDYRVYRDGLQIASTVATHARATGESRYEVKGVDTWGNCRP